MIIIKYIIIIFILIFFFYSINIFLKKKIYEKYDNIIYDELDIDNIFNYCTDDTESNNVYYYIKKDKIGNAILTLGISNNKILSPSNEYLSLIKSYYPSGSMYTEIIKYYKYIIDNINNKYIIDENVICFITTFSTGTIHGYSGLFYILIEYIKNFDKYKDYKIIIYKNSQKGILDIIYYLSKNNIISNNIIIIDSDIIYNFKNMIIIPNKKHSVENDFAIEISEFIDKYLIKNNFDEIYERVSIIKSSISNNLTSDGIVSQEEINTFSQNNYLVSIEPTNYNEVDFINILNNVNFIVFSWGTTFFKNYYYISDKCTNIIVVIIGESYIKQYNDTVNNNKLITYFKNAHIEYRILESSLSTIII
jgi:hypothetical protein